MRIKALTLVITTTENVVLSLLLEVLRDGLRDVSRVEIIEDVLLRCFFRFRLYHAIQGCLHRFLLVAPERWRLVRLHTRFLLLIAVDSVKFVLFLINQRRIVIEGR